MTGLVFTSRCVSPPMQLTRPNNQTPGPPPSVCQHSNGAATDHRGCTPFDAPSLKTAASILEKPASCELCAVAINRPADRPTDRPLPPIIREHLPNLYPTTQSRPRSRPRTRLGPSASLISGHGHLQLLVLRRYDCYGGVLGFARALIGLGKSRDALYENVLAENEREAVADLLQYLENVKRHSTPTDATRH